jgi:hypothetical protein
MKNGRSDPWKLMENVFDHVSDVIRISLFVCVVSFGGLSPPLPGFPLLHMRCYSVRGAYCVFFLFAPSFLAHSSMKHSRSTSGGWE